MIDYIKQLLSEKGSASIMRLAFILLIINGIMIAWVHALFCFIIAYYEAKGVKININFDYLAIMTAMFSTATVLKIGQKMQEQRVGNAENNTN